VESSVHPDTKQIIPEPFRMAGYVPFNGPVCVAMMASRGTPALLFWNWVNQVTSIHCANVSISAYFQKEMSRTFQSKSTCFKRKVAEFTYP
jgi:hypothetical protein